MIRKLVSTLNSKILRRLSPSRRELHVPVTITLGPDKNTGKLSLKKEDYCIAGETVDLSEGGMSFIVDSIRLKDQYLVGEDRVLNAQLDLPNGKISLKVIGLRYEQVGQHASIAKYLIGAKITDIGEIEAKIYKEYLRYGDKVMERRARRLKVKMEEG